MKSKLILVYISIFLLTLSGCGGKQYTENTYIDGQDFQYMYFRQGSNPIMAESENGYYFFSGCYLYYADKTTMKPIILCNKPNCLHDNEQNDKKVINCNAFFYNHAWPFISYYDGDIYVISGIVGKNEEYELIRISADGTKRKSILKFDARPMSVAIHRGKVYYAQTAYDKNQKSVYSINEFELSGFNRKPKMIYEGKLEGGQIQDLMCYGNNIYFTEFAHSQKAFTTITMRYDLLTKEASKLFPNINVNEVSSYPAVFSEKLYYSVSQYNPDGTSQESNSFMCDLDGKNSKRIFDLDKDSVFLSDIKYLYSNDLRWSADAKPKDQQMLRILDKDGKVQNSLKTGDINDYGDIICGGDLHLFIISGTESKYQIYFVDKSKFGHDNIELKPFFEIDKDRMTPAVTIDSDTIIEN